MVYFRENRRGFLFCNKSFHKCPWRLRDALALARGLRRVVCPRCNPVLSPRGERGQRRPSPTRGPAAQGEAGCWHPPWGGGCQGAEACPPCDQHTRATCQSPGGRTTRGLTAERQQVAKVSGGWPVPLSALPLAPWSARTWREWAPGALTIRSMAAARPARLGRHRKRRR